MAVANEDDEFITELFQVFKHTTFDQTVSRILDFINYKVDENKA